MKEENDEYLEAVLQNDLVEIADALEINFTPAGTILTHGMQHNRAVIENSSNMSKLDTNGSIING
jgi:hypothetical protein